MQLSSLLSDTAVMREGDWVLVDPAFFQDLEIKTRGYTDEFVDAQAAMNAAARNDLNLSPTDSLPNAEQRRINAELLKKFLILDVRNLMDNDKPVTIEQFHELLFSPSAGRLARACWTAVGKISAKTMKKQEADLGNS